MNLNERKTVYCSQCSLRIAPYADKSRDGTMHAHCAKINRRYQLTLADRFASMSEDELNEFKKARAKEGI